VKRVYRAASLLQVAHARNILVAAGVECELRNIYLAGALGELPMMETWPQLWVHDADERYAESLLAGAARRALGLRGLPRAARAAVHLLLALRRRALATLESLRLAVEPLAPHVPVAIIRAEKAAPPAVSRPGYLVFHRVVLL
jgi:hypothetical protein